MRPVIIQVPEENGEYAVKFALDHDAKNLNIVKAADQEKNISVITSYISNGKLESLIEKLSSIKDVQITIHPQGVLPLYPPEDETPDQVIDVEMRSPIEIFLSGLQSIGSWKGFLSYAFLTGIIVWIGLYTNTEYLLVAAMLIAPFAGPAMNFAIATARGDWILLINSLKRYFISIFITIFVSWILTLLLNPEIATSLMIERSKVSSVALLLALTAGAAGGINLIQSERDSLVSGAAVGMLVAASLAPPAGITGIAAAMGKWDIAGSGLFLIFLQLAGINITGTLVFKLAGLKSIGPRYNRGKKKLIVLSVGITLIFFTALVIYQYSTPVELQRSSISKIASEDIKKMIDARDDIYLIDIQSRFTRSYTDEDILLVTVYAMQNESLNKPVKTEIARDIQRMLRKNYPFTPLVDIILLVNAQ
jgi:uncharacterized hydrophobic protein (TIGR00271 family)